MLYLLSYACSLPPQEDPQTKNKVERETRFELATLAQADALPTELLPLIARRQIVVGEGFEPSKAERQIYSLPR